jgi:aminoglycoside 2''-phosphotransferase
VLFDPQTQRLSGIIDFGIACYDSPDIDICNLMQCFGETFVTRMLATYPEISTMLPAARFGVHLMELEALAEGLSGDNPHRAVANIAIPRDVRFPIF